MIGLLMPFVVAYSMQFATMFYIFSVTCIILLIWYEKLSSGDGLLFLFFAAGIATSFFDFLTYPLISLGVPLTILMYIRHCKSAAVGLGEVVQKSIIWGAGYVGMWVGKWVLGSTVLGRSIFESAAGALELRSFLNQDSLAAIFQMYYLNVRALAYTPVMAISLIFVGICIYRFSTTRKAHGKVSHKAAFASAAPFLLICLMPFAWFFVKVNHSLVHYFLTSKDLATVAFSGMCIFPYLYEREKENG